MLRHALAGTVAALLLAGVGCDARAHGAEKHDDDATPPAVLAPGYGPLAFDAPEPGSYALPPLGPAADGPALRSDGTPTSLHDEFGDGVALLSFVYASCSDVNGCPLATAVLHRLKTRLAEAPDIADRVRLVSLSFDPARDTPAVMRAYGAGFAGPGPAWSFLTAASESALQPLLEAYGQSIVREVGADGRDLGRISHVLRVFLIDPERRIRNVYSVSFLHPDTLLADLRTVLLEAAPTPGEAHAEARPGLLGPGDDRRGYERPDWRSRSVSLGARRGEPADLLARVSAPPLGLPPVPVPPDEPVSVAKVALGRALFFDRRLSANGTISCAMCHVPEQGFTSNEMRTAVGIEGRSVRRNTPTVYNAAYAPRLFHDGRESRLEAQVWHPLLARNEMGNPSALAVLEKLRDLGYDDGFAAAFPDRGLTRETVGAALASYERTLVSGGSAFDRWHYAGEPDALDPAAQRGFALFVGRAACATCHVIGDGHALFSDFGFHDTGTGFARAQGMPSPTRRVQVSPGVFVDVDREIVEAVGEAPAVDDGRFEVTQDPADRWRYRTPSLRNVALTAPYMHDGSLATLEDVVAFYDRGGVTHPGLDPRIRPLGLSAGERADLAAFLRALTGDDVETLVRDAFAAAPPRAD